MRLAVARLEHRHQRLVGVQHGVPQEVLLERIDQRLQLHAAGAEESDQNSASPPALTTRLLPLRPAIVRVGFSPKRRGPYCYIIRVSAR